MSKKRQADDSPDAGQNELPQERLGVDASPQDVKVRKRMTDLDLNQAGYDQAGYRAGQAARAKADFDRALAEEEGRGFNEPYNAYDEHTNIGKSWQAGFDAGPDGNPTAGVNLGEDTGPDGSNVIGTSHADEVPGDDPQAGETASRR